MAEESFRAIRDAIHERHTVYHFDARPLPEGTMERLVESAVWAPNHRLTQPWRFVVVEGAAKEELAELRGRLARERAEREGRGLDRVDAQVAEFREPPAYLYIVRQVAGDEERQREDYAACAIAAYIVQLVAHGMGLGVRWGTGLMARHPAVHQALGLDGDQEIVCFLGLGYEREGSDHPRRRRPAVELTRRLGEHLIT